MTTTVRTFATVDHEGNPARGVKVSAKNMATIHKWLTIDSQFITDGAQKDIRRRLRLRLRTKKGWRVARVGDIIVKKSKDDFFVIKADV